MLNIKRIRLKVKKILCIETDEKDYLIDFYIESIRDKMLIYCNRKDFPEQLVSILTDEVIKTLKFEEAETEVKSITLGDTKTEYTTKTEYIMLSNVKELLKPFVIRKTRFL